MTKAVEIAEGMHKSLKEFGAVGRSDSDQHS
jgi:hypothetical protein